MIIQHYCYTRTNYIDYGDIVSPTGISEKEIDVVRKKILSITADVYLKLSTPKWLLIKNKNQIVWGCCCWNSLLAVEKSKDYSGTPVYGFFSIVISDYSSTDDIKLPFDIEYFRQLYSLEVEPFWNRREEHRNKTDDYIQGDFKYIHSNYNQYVSIINTDKFRCKSLGNIDREDVVAAAMTLYEVSLIIDNDNIEQAANKSGAFMNCLSSYVTETEVSIKQPCPKCKKYVTSYTDKGICTECKRKEDEIKQEEEDMDKQLKRDLEDANSKIQYLEYAIEEANKQIKKKNQLIKILLWISIILLLVLVFTCRDSLNFSTYMFGNKQNTETYQETIVTNNQNTSDYKVNFEHEN